MERGTRGHVGDDEQQSDSSNISKTEVSTVENSPVAKPPTEEIILTSLGGDDTDEAIGSQAVIDESDPFVQQVNRLVVGCWFEFSNDARPERCKLAAIIKATGKYIFVNRSGVKVAEKTRMGLAVEMRRGGVQMLNDGLLFDRALESVIGSLRGKTNK